MRYLSKKFLVVLFTLIILSVITPVAAGTTWYVDDDGSGSNLTTIQAAIDAASAGDTIIVRDGTYSENVDVDDDLMIYSRDKAGFENPDFVPGELIVKFKSDASVRPSVSIKGIATTGYNSIDSLNNQYGVTSLEKVFETAKKPVTRKIPDPTNIYLLELPKDADILSIAREYQMDTNVEYAEPNYITHICTIPNDPYYSQQWAHQKMQSEQAWDIETGNQSVVIAIVDTGVDWNHPDLAENIWNNTDEILDGNDTDGNGFIDDVRGWDFVETSSPVYPGEDGAIEDNDPMDFHGHGTHCSGIVGAVTNNGIGVAGTCWNCSIMAVRAGYKTESGGGVLESDDCSAAIVYAADNGADVISMSWGGSSSSSLIEDSIDYAYGKGVILVAAAGNSNTNLKFYPAGYDN
ncbi:MAG: S8 family serine peptidase, partial [Halobacteriota archaeon]|nr:S8 family serine peptidase [Halobacteriota archaeon]